MRTTRDLTGKKNFFIKKILFSADVRVIGVFPFLRKSTFRVSLEDEETQEMSCVGFGGEAKRVRK